MEFPPEQLAILDRFRPKTASRWLEPKHHVLAFAVVDHGNEPGLGEVRLSDPDDQPQREDNALALACRLARGSSIRAGLLGLPCGGAVVVVLDHPQLDRPACTKMLGERLRDNQIAAVAGLGFDGDSDHAVALSSPSSEALRRARGRVLDACIEPLTNDTAGLRRALVVGATAHGHDLAAHLRERGVEVSLWDSSAEAAEEAASRAQVTVHTDHWADAEVDLLVPCLPYPSIDEDLAGRVAARIVAGGVPRVFASAGAREALEARGHHAVPEVVAATADLIVVADEAGLLQLDTTLDDLAQVAREAITGAPGAHDRALTIAIERARRMRAKAD